MNKYEMYDPKTDKLKKVSNLYGRQAKAIYKNYINILGWEPETFLPMGMTHKNNRFHHQIATKTATKWKPSPQHKSATALKGMVETHSIENDGEWTGLRGLDLIKHFEGVLRKYLQTHTGCKRQFIAKLLFHKHENGETTYDTVPIRSEFLTITNATEIKTSIQNAISILKEKVDEVGHKMKGSGWIFAKVTSVELGIAEYVPLMAGSWIPTPHVLRSKGVVNVQNPNDQECFKWSVLSAIHPVPKHTERLSNYSKIDHGLDFSGLEYPLKVSDIPKFERRNNIAIHLYGYDNEYKDKDCFNGSIPNNPPCDPNNPNSPNAPSHKPKPYVIQMSSLVNQEVHVDKKVEPRRTIHLLHLENKEGNSHYCWIKNFSRFACHDHGHNGERTYCDFCLKSFGKSRTCSAQENLQKHLDLGCQNITTARPKMPTEGVNDLIEFKNNQNTIKAPYAIYSDFECVLEDVKDEHKDPSKIGSYTTAYQKHVPCGYTIYVTSHKDEKGKTEFTPKSYRGTSEKDTMDHFMNDMKMMESTVMKKLEKRGRSIRTTT